jgi:hypothetical protein
MKGERGWEAKKLKEKGKTKNEVEQKQSNKQKKFPRYKWGEMVY